MSVPGLVGSVHESDAAHWKRNADDPSSSTCGHCVYIRNKAELWREHPWLSPRPAFMGGDWALGCIVCSWRHKNSEIGIRKGKPRGSKLRASTFAAFKFVCHDAQLRYRVQVHSVEAGHRIAMLASHQATLEVLQGCTAARSIGPLAEAIPRPLAVNILEAKAKRSEEQRVGKECQY